VTITTQRNVDDAAAADVVAQIATSAAHRAEIDDDDGARSHDFALREVLGRQEQGRQDQSTARPPAPTTRPPRVVRDAPDEHDVQDAPGGGGEEESKMEDVD
jgi:hypothetical protein